MAYSGEEYGNYSYEYDLEYGDLEELRVEHRQWEALHIVSVVIYIVSFVLGLVGNGIVIWVTAFKSKKTVKSIWLLNLAMADFVFLLFLPLQIDYILRDFHWDFGMALCKINSFVSVLNMYASVLFLTVLSIDRYVSLVHLGWSQRYRTRKGSWIVCGCIWSVAAAMSCPALIFRDTMRLHDRVICFNNFHTQEGRTAATTHLILVVFRTIVGFLLPFTAICVTSILLMIKVKQSRGLVRRSRFSKMISAVILAFFLCWAPFHVFSLMELSIHSSLNLQNTLRTGFPLATSFGFFNSCINPLLYMLLGKKVRHILKRACLDLTKRSMRELSSSLSTTNVEDVADVYQGSRSEVKLESLAK